MRRKLCDISSGLYFAEKTEIRNKNREIPSKGKLFKFEYS